MNLFNSVKTQRVSKKTYAPLIREVISSSDGSLKFQPMKNEPIIGDADDFSLANQIKTGVKFDAPNGAFFKENRLVVSDMVQDGSDYLLRVTPESTVESTLEPTAEPTAEPTVEPTAEPTVEPTVS